MKTKKETRLEKYFFLRVFEDSKTFVFLFMATTDFVDSDEPDDYVSFR